VLLECVPNVSEGTSKAILDALAQSIASVEGAFLLDTHADPDHNRAVFTFVGSRATVVEAAFRLIGQATALLDIRRHQGVHPRMGCVDVCPFVALGRTPREEAAAAARALAERVAGELGIPVYLYGDAALRPERSSLPHVRRSGFEELARTISVDPDRRPDLGPAALHPTFGAIAIGARPPLVAFNVDLATEDLDLARSIAARLRESGGGLPAVRALGFPLATRKRVQVSCNLLDGEKTPPSVVFEATKREAARKAISVERGELVGLMPRRVAYRSLAHLLALESFGPAQVLEDRLDAFLPLAPYLDAVADPASGIGGGAVAADVAALAASLVAFVEGVVEKGPRTRTSPFEDFAVRFLSLSRSDRHAYADIAAIRSRPPGPERDAALTAALARACEVPVKVMETIAATLAKAREVSVRGSIAVDLGIAAHLLSAAALSARDTLDANLRSKHAAPFRSELAARSEALARLIEAAARDLAGAS
jgi:glutamate formiminotransferase / formiminotetrahydrofolate cyclodeaminase